MENALEIQAQRSDRARSNLLFQRFIFNSEDFFSINIVLSSSSTYDLQHKTFLSIIKTEA